MAQTERVTKQELQEDKFIVFVMDVYSFLLKNAKTLIILGVAIVIALAAVSLYFYQQEQSEHAASLKMGEALTAFSEGESNWLNPEEHENSQAQFEKARDGFQRIVQDHGSSSYADKALFYHGKTLFYLKEYDQALESFRELTEKHPDSLFALHAQLAIGRTYEQKGGDANLQRALEELAPEKFTRFARLPLQERELVQTMATLDRARYYEKLNQPEKALESYELIIASFQSNLQQLIMQRSREAMRAMKVIVESVEADLTGVDELVRQELDKAAVHEGDGEYFEALNGYLRAVHLYRILKENQKTLAADLREQIMKLEKRTENFIEGIQNARRSEEEQRLSSALYSYEQALGGLTFAPSRNVYEKARAEAARLKSLVEVEQTDRVQLSEAS